MINRPSDIEWDPVSIFVHVLRRMFPRSPLPLVRVAFRPFAGMNHTIRLRDGILQVCLSDLMSGSPPKMMEAIAVILLAKLFRRSIPAAIHKLYFRYVNSSAVQEKIIEARRDRGRKRATISKGKIHDLPKLFQKLNACYFGAMLPSPKLAWSRAASTKTLGHYDPAHNTIVMSRILDHEAVPQVLVEYILYHEMLHMKHPVEHCGGRRKVHSPAFTTDERRFHGYQEARAVLKALLV